MGIETPRLAMTIVPTSAAELRRMAEMRPNRIPDEQGEDECEDGQLDLREGARSGRL